MTEKNRSPPLSDGTSTEAIEPTILFPERTGTSIWN